MTETKRTKAQLLKENDRPRAEVGTLHPAETEQASPRDIIREALDRADTEILRREAHAINGGAANLAAAELSSAAAELENGQVGLARRGPRCAGETGEGIQRLDEFVHKP